ncbi:hypothetical protein GQ457_13G009030 [Hibiscus cannabinus]
MSTGTLAIHVSVLLQGYRYHNLDFNPVMNSVFFLCLEYRYFSCSTGTHESGWQAGCRGCRQGAAKSIPTHA